MYLEDKELNTVLEEYFEYINESVSIQKPYEDSPEMVATYKVISKNIKIIEKEVNKICKEIFDDIKNQIESNKLDDSVEYYEKDFKQMINSNKAPVLDYIDSNNTEVYAMQLKCYPSSIWNECIMAFEDKVYKKLRVSKVMKKIGLKFGVEDYNGIFIFYNT